MAPPRCSLAVAPGGVATRLPVQNGLFNLTELLHIRQHERARGLAGECHAQQHETFERHAIGARSGIAFAIAPECRCDLQEVRVMPARRQFHLYQIDTEQYLAVRLAGKNVRPAGWWSLPCHRRWIPDRRCVAKNLNASILPSLKDEA